MDQDRDSCCLICRDDEGEFLTRCNHRYHLECLSWWFKVGHKECPLCRGLISRCQLTEDMMGKRKYNLEVFSKQNSAGEIDLNLIKWAIESRQMDILSELLNSGVDLIGKICNLKEDAEYIKSLIKGNIKNEVISLDSKVLTFKRKQLNTIKYVIRYGILDALKMASKHGQLDIVEYILDYPSNYLLSNCSILNNCIETAVGCGQEDVVKLLLSKGTGLNAIDTAAKYGLLQFVKYFDETSGFKSTSNAAQWAIDGNHIKTFKYLIKNGHTCTPEAVDSVAEREQFRLLKYLIVEKGLSSTHKATDFMAKIGHYDSVKLLIESGQECSAAAIENASRSGYLNVVKLLLESGKKCSSKAIDFAAENGHFEVVKYLVDHKKAACSTDAIDRAALGGHYKVVKYLVDKGKEFTENAVVFGIQRGHLGIVRCFIKSGHECKADAIDLAAQGGHFEIVKILLEHGNPCTSKAIQMATRGGHLKIVKLLFNYRKPCDSDLITQAAQCGHLKIVQYLVEHRKCCVSTDTFDIAAKGGHSKIIKYLRKNALVKEV